MQITIRLEAQIRRAAGRSSATLQINRPATVTDAVRQLANEADEPLKRLLVDDAGTVRPTLMLFLNDEHVPLPGDRTLDSEAVITITSPISGG